MTVNSRTLLAGEDKHGTVVVGDGRAHFFIVCGLGVVVRADGRAIVDKQGQSIVHWVAGGAGLDANGGG